MPSYWIDFECWKIEADNEDDAVNEAIKEIHAGHLPKIVDAVLVDAEFDTSVDAGFGGDTGIDADFIPPNAKRMR